MTGKSTTKAARNRLDRLYAARILPVQGKRNGATRPGVK